MSPTLRIARQAASIFAAALAAVACGGGGSGGSSPTVAAPLQLQMFPPVTVEATSPAGAQVTLPTPTTNDSAAVVTCPPTAQYPLGKTSVTCTARNAAGDTVQGTSSVTVVDTTPPVLTMFAPITAAPTSAAGATLVLPAPTATDLASTPLVTCDHPIGTAITFPTGVSTIGCTATDGAGNSATGTSTVTVAAFVPLTMTMFAPITAEATGPAGAKVAVPAPQPSDASATVACDITLGNPIPFNLGTTTVHCTATNPAGQTATGTSTVTVVDTTAPTLTMFAPITVTATSAAGASVTVPTPTAVDLVSVPTLACSQALGVPLPFPLGTSTVTCTATDAAGNASQGSSTITVVAGRFTIGGSVSGLAGSGLVLQDNAADDLGVGANGPFTFATALATGTTYNVTVKTQPASPAQTCSVTNGSGTVGTAGVTSVAVACATNVVVPSYVITNLGDLVGSATIFTSHGSTAYTLNSSGQVSGTSTTVLPNGNGGPIHAFLWTPTAANGTTGGMIDLTPASTGIDDADRTHINDFGQVLYTDGSTLPGVQRTPVLWTPASPNGTTGTAVALLAATSDGFGLNNAGQVVGFVTPGICFAWTPFVRNGTAGAENHHFDATRQQDLAGYGFGPCTSAQAINDAGQVTGSAGLGFFSRPFIHANGAPPFPNSGQIDFGGIDGTDLVGPGANTNPNDSTFSGGAVAINASGHLVGGMVLPGVGLHPFLWNGTLIDVAPKSGGGGHAWGINAQDQVVGDMVTPAAGGSAFLYDKGTTYQLFSLVEPLSRQGWTALNFAYAINDKGQIVGSGVFNGQGRAFLLTPR